jgi:hypothetical protein
MWLHPASGRWYIGSRTAKGCRQDDGYICSSKTVKPLILANPADWVRTILFVGDKPTVLQVEKELLMRLKVVPSQLSLNASYFVGVDDNRLSVDSEAVKRRSNSTAKGKTMLRKTLVDGNRLSVDSRAVKRPEYVPQTGDRSKQFKGTILRCSISDCDPSITKRSSLHEQALDEATLVLSGTKAIREAGYCSSSVYKAVKSGSLYKGYLWLRIESINQQEI